MDQKKNISLPKENVKFLSDYRKERSESTNTIIVPPEFSRYVEGMLNEMIHTDPGCDERVGLDQAVKNLDNWAIITEEPEFLETEEAVKEFQNRWLRESEDGLLHTPSYKRAQEAKEEILWRGLANISVQQAIVEWTDTITNPRTRRAYEMAMEELCKNGLIKKHMSLQAFSMRNHDVTVDKIKTGDFSYKKKMKCPETKKLIDKPMKWSEATKQLRCAAFISFTRHLERKHEGIIRKALPEKDGEGRTFKRVRNKVKTEAFACRRDWLRFFKELHDVNPRDALIGKLQLQGGKRISEVLGLETHMINFEKREITFKQAKTKGTEDTTIISYSTEVMDELKKHVGDRKGLVFVTSSGKPISHQHLERNFSLAGRRAGISFRVTSHCLRATCVTYLKSEGFSDSDIMKVTGHADSEMIGMYDKSSKADNASKKVNLI